MTTVAVPKLRGDIGVIHFIGIGGIGMSGIAEVMKTLGYRVQGSDVSDGGYVIPRLREQGIVVHIGHKAENLGDAAVVVVSTAIKAGNPEVDLAREKHVPIVRRAEMLAELMRFKSTIAVAGTHGKTTTTSLVGAVLDKAALDPTVINGGIINAYGTNARLGAGEWMVVEADESDGTFLRLPATIGIVTNIDPEHLDHYGHFDAVKSAFEGFIERLPFYGVGIVCVDHPEVQALVQRVIDRRLVTYGFNPQADVRIYDVEPVAGGNRFSVELYDRRTGTSRKIENITLNMPGRHNVQNATSAIAVARELGISDTAVKAALAEFKGVKRRFTKTGETGGVSVIDDYGHHPVEIKAVLSAAREGVKGRIFAVVQPHRFTRLRDLLNDFATCMNDADTVIVAPVYTAGEQPIDGVTHEALASAIRASGHRSVMTIESAADLAPLVKAHATAGDMVVCLGAGDITKWAGALPKELEQLA
jgi:UDP-N-acetylmuramate--alanine ligase